MSLIAEKFGGTRCLLDSEEGLTVFIYIYIYKDVSHTPYSIVFCAPEVPDRSHFVTNVATALLTMFMTGSHTFNTHFLYFHQIYHTLKTE